MQPRIALRPKEAAEALGISERTFRQILPDLPHFRIGGAVLIPVDLLGEWARKQAEAELGRSARMADEILDKMNE